MLCCNICRHPVGAVAFPPLLLVNSSGFTQLCQVCSHIIYTLASISANLYIRMACQIVGIQETLRRTQEAYFSEAHLITILVS